jgi:hypothetical protein
MSDPIIPLTTAQTALQEAQASKEGYLLNVLIGLDMFANTALGGKPDETISSNTALLDRKHKFVGKVVSAALDLFQPDHGAKAAAGDLERAQAEVSLVQASGIIDVP